MAKKWVKSLRAAFFIILIFTMLDYVLHFFGFLVPKTESLPRFYFLFKIIGGTLILWGLIYFTSTKNKLSKSIFFKAILVSIFLQVRYYLIAVYSPGVNAVMFIIHTMLIIASYYVYEGILNYEGTLKRFKK